MVVDDEAEEDDSPYGGMFEETEWTPPSPSAVSAPVDVPAAKEELNVKEDGTLADRLSDAVDREVDSSKILAAIKQAPLEARAAVGANSALVSKLSGWLYKEDFFEGMVLLRVRQEGTVAHGTAENADIQVRAGLEEHVRAAVEGGVLRAQGHRPARHRARQLRQGARRGATARRARG